MKDSVAAPAARRTLHSPLELEETEAFQKLVALVHEGKGEKTIAAGNLWGSAQAMVLGGLVEHAQGPWLAVTSTETEAEQFAEDLKTFGRRPALFPARPTAVGGSGIDPEAVRRRLQAAQLLSGPPERRPRLFVASLLSMLQPVPSPRDIENDFLHLQVSQRLDPEDLLERLVTSGYTRQPLAESPGEISLRGDILDVFPFAADLPLRIELFDEEIESLRSFDPESQRSVESQKQVAICVASDAGGIEDGKGVQPFHLLSPTTVLVEIEPLRVEDQAEGLRIRSSAHARALTQFRQSGRAMQHVSLQSLPAETVNFDTRSVQSFAVGMRDAPAFIRQRVRAGDRVCVLSRTQTEADRVRELVEESEELPGFESQVGSLAKGFQVPARRLVLVTHRELLGVAGPQARAQQRKRHRVRALESFFELKAGDLVVHAVHGVGRFLGLSLMERVGGEEEHLELLFADEVRIFVPSSRIDLVQRYIGSGSAAPELDKVGGTSFRKRKERVERALIDLAAELLEVQAKRELNERPPWQVDQDLVDTLIGTFPYADTKDQATSEAEIAKDLVSRRPMDRLLCGDVGFGKTEVAVRAALRVVTGGGQVAVLVPTTVLAKQHFETLRERLADLPVEVGLLSRHVTGKHARDTIERTARGEVDILVGTHRLLSKDVSFQRLGLAVIDEEQRFGVTHKEHFKKFRAQIDVLTLTATPIPRTLHMSLAGLRDISALTEPPPGRQEIETKIAWSQDVALVREAILREKQRGGQVFFLHNRVQSIERVARELLTLVPECTFLIGHGQMGGKELVSVMDRFIRGEADVLVATTIVENGIDIPTAGTILIDDANHFGLSELHQLRGRVGRGEHKSYCYLLVDRTRPMRAVARERLKALEELTQLGAGFQISMKDLEIRGAGNILGPQQSGHIAAIGYDMYCRLLKKTVERMETAHAGLGTPREELMTSVPAEVTDELEASAIELELGVDAFLPADWISDQNERFELLRRLNAIHTDDEAEDALAMMRDRYGRVPEAAQTLLRQFRLRARLEPLGIRQLRWRQETYLLGYGDRVALERALGGGEFELRPVRAGLAHLVIPHAHRGTAVSALRWIEGILLPETAVSKMGEAGDKS